MTKKHDDPVRRVKNLRAFYEATLPEVLEEAIVRRIRRLGLDPERVNQEVKFSMDAAVTRFYAARMRASATNETHQPRESAGPPRKRKEVQSPDGDVSSLSEKHDGLEQ